ncbi:MAG: prephenate dehydrogenase [Phycisphaerae bacterium]|nr:prephenate dehydrogenase [Phycisphaerae bacterium]
MAKRSVQYVTIIGVGLLGGSIGLAIRRRFPKARVAGVGRRRSSLDLAKKHKCIHEAYFDAAEPVRRSDLVILATPVGAFEKHLRAIQPVLRPGALVTDVGSTKGQVVCTAERICGRGGAFVGSHPMAGRENKGPAHATADLLHGALCVVTPTKHTPAALVRRTEALWRALGMRTLCMNPAEHDRAAAAVSHVPHALSALLMLLPKDDELPVSATGLRDMTRLAGGDPEMWRDIMTTNQKPVLASLEKLSRSLKRLRTMLENNNARAIERFFARAKHRRDTTLK